MVYQLRRQRAYWVSYVCGLCWSRASCFLGGIAGLTLCSFYWSVFHSSLLLCRQCGFGRRQAVINSGLTRWVIDCANSTTYDAASHRSYCICYVSSCEVYCQWTHTYGCAHCAQCIGDCDSKSCAFGTCTSLLQQFGTYIQSTPILSRGSRCQNSDCRNPDSCGFCMFNIAYAGFGQY